MVAVTEPMQAGSEIRPRHSCSEHRSADYVAAQLQKVVTLSVDSGVATEPTEKQQWLDTLEAQKRSPAKTSILFCRPWCSPLFSEREISDLDSLFSQQQLQWNQTLTGPLRGMENLKSLLLAQWMENMMGPLLAQRMKTMRRPLLTQVGVTLGILSFLFDSELCDSL